MGNVTGILLIYIPDMHHDHPRLSVSKMNVYVALLYFNSGQTEFTVYCQYQHNYQIAK